MNAKLACDATRNCCQIFTNNSNIFIYILPLQNLRKLHHQKNIYNSILSETLVFVASPNINTLNRAIIQELNNSLLHSFVLGEKQPKIKPEKTLKK